MTSQNREILVVSLVLIISVRYISKKENGNVYSDYIISKHVHVSERLLKFFSYFRR